MSNSKRKRKLEKVEQSLVNWEQRNIFPKKVRNEMECMWEIPQTFHFLHLAKEALNMPHLSMYEMERMLMIPRASRQLANIMTSLLSSPIQKPKLRKVPPMPYEFWTNILAYKMKSWFQVYEGKQQDTVKVLEAIGVEPEFWSVFPDAPLVNGKDFEELTFKQRVWLLKTVCDTVMHSRKTVQEEVAKQPWEDQFETMLGTDRYGARYIYFPQFLQTDLRVYRHCLDNTILSTVKPIKPKETENAAAERDQAATKKPKHKRKKSRWRNGIGPPKKKKRNKPEEKHLNDCKYSSDSATGSLANEDTNFSSTSTCSNNNNVNSNNNNISSDATDEKRAKSLSKCSEISADSAETHCKSTKSSGYDTNSSVGTNSAEKPTQKMFKGFSKNDKCNIERISGILRDLKTEVGEGTGDADVSLRHAPQNKLEVNSNKQYLDTIDLCIDGGESVDRTVDNLCSVSKTDDEKLNEIISAESLKMNDKSSSDFRAARKTHQVSSTSKSDDEKLSETRTTSSTVSESGNGTPAEGEKGGKVTRPNEQLAEEQKSNDLIVNDEETVQPDQTNKAIDNNEEESHDDKDLSLNELRSMLQKEAMEDNFVLEEDGDTKNDLRKLEKEEEADGWKRKVNDFNKMLLALGTSKFELVADSVNALRDLISTLSPTSNTANAEENCDTPNQDANCSTAHTITDCNTSKDTEDDNESIPPCEEKLVIKLSELLSSLEESESTLRDSTRKARLKLHKEWIKFKEGVVEDQDSSGEGLGSNWWVLGSQGCPLPTQGDGTIQTLSQPTVSRVGSHSTSEKIEDRKEENGVEECSEHEGDRIQTETGEGSRQENAGTEEETQDDSNEEEQQTRRVLRARGISSYTEQFYSDDESEENELDAWTEVEAVYAAPSSQAGASPSHTGSKVKQPDEQTNEEDSDQDWILPSSRKRKNKRPSANRRLKSFQHKLQSIKVDELQEAAESIVVTPSNLPNDKEKPKIKEVQIYRVRKPIGSRSSSIDTNDASLNTDNTVETPETAVENNPKETVPSTTEETVCKVENVESVHSELDIKDEGPIYDAVPNQYDNGYSACFNPNYVMLKTEQNPMNYYVMQPNSAIVPQNAIVQQGPMVSSIMPPVQQGYYMQGGQNYIIQNSQSGFMSSQTFQSQGPQMMAPQQFVAQPGYVPYMVTTQQPQPGYMEPQIVTQQVPQAASVSFHGNAAAPVRPQLRQPLPRHSHPPPNGAVIRSSMPIRGNFPRGNIRVPRSYTLHRAPAPKTQKPKTPSAPVQNTSQKTTSLIVLSDSDDEIEMIIHEKTGPETETDKTKSASRKSTVQPEQTPTVTSDATVAATPRGTIPPQIIQRMSQGGISITPIKPAAPPIQNANTQLVVVVNETGSHYALALPNGSKLILTPEQVAQIRASNGGKLVL